MDLEQTVIGVELDQASRASCTSYKSKDLKTIKVDLTVIIWLACVVKTFK